MLPAAILLATVFAHWAVWALPSPDVTQFLSHWYRHIAETGLVEAFSEPFGNYSPTYLYLLGLLTLSEDWLSVHDGVKLLSVAGSILLGLSVLRLLQVLEFRKAALRSLWTPLASQCLRQRSHAVAVRRTLGWRPASWPWPASLERRHAAMLAWAGLAFAVKGQAAFLAPFLFAVLIARRVPLLLLADPTCSRRPDHGAGPACRLAAAEHLFKYVEQGGQQPSFVSNAPNIWAPPAVFAPELGRAMVPAGFLVAALLSLGLAWWLRSRLGDPVTLLRAALFSALFVPTMLPKMHERYFPARRSPGLCSRTRVSQSTERDCSES
jgi:hypothetical protein